MPSTTRRNLLAASALAALGARTATAQSPVASPGAAATPIASPGASVGSLGPCGLDYDVGSEMTIGEITRPAEHEQYFRDELIAIRDQLHTPTVAISGSVPDQLIAGLGTAADLGFDIRLQTRLNFLSQDDMVDRLQTVAVEAEKVRQNGIPIVLDVGCEYLIFAKDLVEGNDATDKITTILAGEVDWATVMPQFLGMLDTMATTARAEFGGLIAYSDTPDEASKWDAFDIVGIDHYLSSDSAETYVQTIDDLAALGKPVWVSEFGSATWQGAAAEGGMGWNIVDSSTDPPSIREGIIRDEDEQAQAILDTLSMIDVSNAERAYLYEFIAPGSTRSNDPRYDWDLLSYSIVAVWGSDSDQPYDTTGHWEPKVAFGELAAWNEER